jgi:hypothetical protein
MRSNLNFFPILFAFALISCKSSKSILYPYELEIIVKDNLAGGALTIKEDTIMALNDSSAYS